MTSRILVALRVDASPTRAFDAFVHEIAHWWRPNVLFSFVPGRTGTLAFEPCLGGRFTETGADGAAFEIGRITVWEPGKRLSFTWRQAGFTADQITTVHVCFDAVDSQTRITVEHEGWDAIAQDHVARHHFPDRIFLQRHGEWWQTLLHSVAAEVSGP